MTEADTPALRLLAAARACAAEDPGLAGLDVAQRRELNELLNRLQPLASRVPVDSEQARRDHAARIYFDYSLMGIIETDADWRILRANPAAASIYGLDRKALAGLPLAHNLAPASRPQLQRHLALLLEQGINQAEWELQQADGGCATIEIASIQVDDDLYVHVFDDVTQQRATAVELERSRAAAESANRAKSEFLANISHEIRTPMNGIIGLSRLALMEDLPDQQREYLEKIAQSGRSLLNILNELLDFAKLEAGRVEFERIVFDLDEVLDELATLAAQHPAHADLEVVFRVPAAIPRQLVGDPLRLLQCLSNLVSNAIKFTPAGRVELAVEPMDGPDGRTWLAFRVEDTGIGIDAETRARLFQPFSQAEAGTTRRFGGTGLGLAIAHELAQGMGGSLELDSEPGQGSSFSLSLPFFRPKTAEAPMVAPACGRTVALLGLREATARAVAEMFEALGWQIATVSDAAGVDPDLWLLDAAERLEPLVQALQDRSDQRLLLLSGPDGTGTVPEQGAGLLVATAMRPLTPYSLQRALRRLGLEAETESAVGLGEAVPDEFRGAWVLVVEDNPVNQFLLVSLLEKAGIRTQLCENGQQAIDWLSDPVHCPDLVLMDVQMPVLDGLEASRRLREQGRQLPVIGLSAGVSQNEQNACLAAGMNDFLPKPLDQDELWGCLTRWIPPRGAMSDNAPAETAEQRFLDDRAALQRARMLFAETHAEDAARMRAEHRAGDIAALRRRAHGLKGSARTLGADKVAALAEAIETGLEDGPEQLPDLIGQLDQALGTFLEAL
jgi:two-component system sensor histidine kinase/response regulator